MKKLGAVLALACTLAVFVFTCVAMASDGQGILVVIATGPAMLALLSLSALLTRRGAPRIFILTKILAVLLVAFFVLSPIPVLNLYTAAVMGGVSGGYSLVYGETPYTAHHHVLDLPALLKASLEAQGGNTLDLRGFHLPNDWQRICIFGPHTLNDAVAAVGIPADFPLSTYSKVGSRDDLTAVLLVGDRYPQNTVDLPRSFMEFEGGIFGTCRDREKAVLLRATTGLFHWAM